VLKHMDISIFTVILNVPNKRLANRMQRTQRFVSCSVAESEAIPITLTHV